MPETETTADPDAMHRVEVTDNGAVFTFVLRETLPGSGDWQAQEVSVRRDDGEALTPTALARLPYGRALREAATQVNTRTPRHPFALPSDPPAAFQEDRRGRSARTDADYAGLAWALLAGGSPSKWSARFGGSPKTWANLLSDARRFIEPTGDMLTGEGMVYVFGDGVWQRLEADHRADRAAAQLLALATMKPGDALWRRLASNGHVPARIKADARARQA